mgnify:CR=1 FL=1
MNKNSVIFNPITCGVAGILAGSILFTAGNGVYQHKKNNSEITKPKLNDFNNWGAYLGLGLGLFFGYTKTPLLIYLSK